MTIAVDLGRKATKTNKQKQKQNLHFKSIVIVTLFMSHLFKQNNVCNTMSKIVKISDCLTLHHGSLAFGVQLCSKKNNVT